MNYIDVFIIYKFLQNSKWNYAELDQYLMFELFIMYFINQILLTILKFIYLLTLFSLRSHTLNETINAPSYYWEK